MEGENMQYHTEYLQAMNALRCADWPLLKNRLSTSGGDLVLAALRTYVAAFEACDDARDAFEHYDFDSTEHVETVCEHLEESGRLYKVYVSASDTLTVAHRVLMTMLLDL